MKLVIDKEKLSFYHNLYTITIYKQDIKKIGIFYRNNPPAIDFDWIISRNFEEIDNISQVSNEQIWGEYHVILKIISNKKQLKAKYSLIGKISYWFNRVLNFNNPLIATSGNYQDSTSIIGKDIILQALNDLKNNGYEVDKQLDIFQAIFNRPTVSENFENNIKKNAKKIFWLFWVIILGLLILVASLYFL